MYTSSGVLLLLEVGTKQNKRSSILNQRELKKTHGKHHACQPAATCYAFQTCGEHQCMQMLLPPPDVKMTRQGQFNRWPIFWYQAYLTQAQTMACLVIMKSAKKRLLTAILRTCALIAGAEAVKKMRQEMIGFLPGSIRGKHGQFHTFTERFLIEDESHPAVKQNKTKLRHLKVHMAGESGLRAKQVCQDQ